MAATAKRCCGGTAKAPQRHKIIYSDGTTEERSSLAAARIRAAKDPKAKIEPIDA